MTVAINVDRKAIEVTWEVGDQVAAPTVTLYAQGEDGAWHNTSELPNDGLGVLTYPGDFSGSSLVEVRDQAGNVIDSGTISVG